MLKRLELKNYRGFENHVLDFRSQTIIVGQNNAGKSTLVEALRIISVLSARLSGLNFQSPPPWAGFTQHSKGIFPSLSGFGIQFDTISHSYSEDPAKIKAFFESGETVEVLINQEGNAFGLLKNRRGRIIKTKKELRISNFPSIEVLPQISPLEDQEKILTDSHVRRNLLSPLASKHFRNQLRIGKKSFEAFRQITEETWPEIQIHELETSKGFDGEPLGLIVRDHEFSAEIGRMGHGLQMWLQIMWFISKCNPTSIVVLDEPDVYLHPNLQRNIVRLVRKKFPQFIVATHSVEIIADLDPSEILIVNRNQAKSEFADKLPVVQRIVSQIGGVHNLHLTRLLSAERWILVEGKDLSCLKQIHDKIFPDTKIPLDNIPNSSIGGWDGWQYAVGQNMLIKNSLGKNIKIYCIFDRDYRIPQEIKNREQDAKEKGVHIHIWKQKELENYFLIPKVIARVIHNTDSNLDLPTITKEVDEKIIQITESLKDIAFDGFAESYRKKYPNKKNGANKYVRSLFGNKLGRPKERLKLVSGKKVLQNLSGWADRKYGRGFSLRDILREILPEEIPQEIQNVVEAIEKNKAF